MWNGMNEEQQEGQYLPQKLVLLQECCWCLKLWHCFLNSQFLVQRQIYGYVLYKTAHSSLDDFSFPLSLGSSTTTIKCVESIASALIAGDVQAIEALYNSYKNDLD